VPAAYFTIKVTVVLSLVEPLAPVIEIVEVLDPWEKLPIIIACSGIIESDS
jgi:hypothetical protein